MSKNPFIEFPLLAHRQILLEGEIGEDNVRTIISQLLFLHMQNAKQPISLFINSLGGSVSSALAIFDTMEFVDSPVHTFGLDATCGMAVWLLAAGEPGFRHCRPSTWIQLVSTRVTSHLPESAAHLAKLNERLVQLLSARSKLSREEVAEAMRIEKTLDAHWARSFGIVDHVIEFPFLNSIP